MVDNRPINYVPINLPEQEIKPESIQDNNSSPVEAEVIYEASPTASDQVDVSESAAFLNADDSTAEEVLTFETEDGKTLTGEEVAALQAKELVKATRESFNDAKGDRGAIGHVADFGKNLFGAKNGSDSVDDYIDDLEDASDELDRLARSGDTEAFARKYKELTGIEFDPNNPILDENHEDLRKITSAGERVGSELQDIREILEKHDKKGSDLAHRINDLDKLLAEPEVGGVRGKDGGNGEAGDLKDLIAQLEENIDPLSSEYKDKSKNLTSEDKEAIKDVIARLEALEDDVAVLEDQGDSLVAKGNKRVDSYIGSQKGWTKNIIVAGAAVVAAVGVAAAPFTGGASLTLTGVAVAAGTGAVIGTAAAAGLTGLDDITGGSHSKSDYISNIKSGAIAGAAAAGGNVVGNRIAAGFGGQVTKTGVTRSTLTSGQRATAAGAEGITDGATGGFVEGYVQTGNLGAALTFAGFGAATGGVLGGGGSKGLSKIKQFRHGADDILPESTVAGKLIDADDAVPENSVGGELIELNAGSADRFDFDASIFDSQVTLRQRASEVIVSVKEKLSNRFGRNLTPDEEALVEEAVVNPSVLDDVSANPTIIETIQQAFREGQASAGTDSIFFRAGQRIGSGEGIGLSDRVGNFIDDTKTAWAEGVDAAGTDSRAFAFGQWLGSGRTGGLFDGFGQHIDNTRQAWTEGVDAAGTDSRAFAFGQWLGSGRTGGLFDGFGQHIDNTRQAWTEGVDAAGTDSRAFAFGQWLGNGRTGQFIDNVSHPIENFRTAFNEGISEADQGFFFRAGQIVRNGLDNRPGQFLQRTANSARQRFNQAKDYLKSKLGRELTPADEAALVSTVIISEGDETFLRSFLNEGQFLEADVLAKANDLGLSVNNLNEITLVQKSGNVVIDTNKVKALGIDPKRIPELNETFAQYKQFTGVQDKLLSAHPIQVADLHNDALGRALPESGDFLSRKAVNADEFRSGLTGERINIEPDQKFTALENLEVHTHKHYSEFIDESLPEQFRVVATTDLDQAAVNYQTAARNFVDNPPAGTYVAKSENGIFYYDPDTKIVAITDKSGGLKTYFRSNDPNRTVNDIHKLLNPNNAKLSRSEQQFLDQWMSDLNQVSGIPTVNVDGETVILPEGITFNNSNGLTQNPFADSAALSALGRQLEAGDEATAALIRQNAALEAEVQDLLALSPTVRGLQGAGETSPVVRVDLDEVHLNEPTPIVQVGEPQEFFRFERVGDSITGENFLRVSDDFSFDSRWAHLDNAPETSALLEQPLPVFDPNSPTAWVYENLIRKSNIQGVDIPEGQAAFGGDIIAGNYETLRRHGYELGGGFTTYNAYDRNLYSAFNGNPDTVPFKMHLLFGGDKELMTRAADIVLPELQKRGLAHKFNTTYIGNSEFTIYPPTAAEAAELSKIFDDAFKKYGLGAEGLSRVGDTPIGDSGLVFFRRQTDDAGNYISSNEIAARGYDPSPVLDEFDRLN